jgi:UDP-N-acetylmuramyl pentapeptide phosphotransferase/UDP-N-acetylglucosamine-1-phosphate transferase
MILINGSNFIDGLNGLLLGYFLIVIFIFFKNDLIQDIILDQKYILYFL